MTRALAFLLLLLPPAVLTAQAPVSQGKAAQANNVWKDDASYAAAKAVDGDLGTRWATDERVERYRFDIDLGAPVLVHLVRARECVTWGARVEAWSLLYLDEDGDWRAAFEAGGMGADHIRPFPPATARHWRLEVTGGRNPTIWEVQLFADGNWPDLEGEARSKLQALQPAIDRAIDRGVDYLLATQSRDGSWTCQNHLYANGQTALSLYALLKCGIAPKHQAIRRGLAFLETELPGETYSAGCELMLLEALDDPARQPRMEAILDQLLGWQQEDGFSYPWVHGGHRWIRDEHRGDLSNMQYAALGLRAAHHAGLRVPDRAWRALFGATLRYQKELRRVTDAAPILVENATGSSERLVAGFGYTAGTGHSYPTGAMTAAGVAILAICEEGLGEDYTSFMRQEGERAMQAGLSWLIRNFRVEANPGQNAWKFYYLYGLERVGSLLGKEFLGNAPWYVLGAEHLVELQSGHGAWTGGNATDEASTCFALLFLKRATRRATTGEQHELRRIGSHASRSGAVHLRATGLGPLAVWIDGFSEEGLAQGVREDLGGPAVRQVEYLVDGAVAKTVPGQPSKGWQGERYPARLEFDEPGPFQVSARVQLVAAGGALRTLASDPVTVTLDEVVAD